MNLSHFPEFSAFAVRAYRQHPDIYDDRTLSLASSELPCQMAFTRHRLGSSERKTCVNCRRWDKAVADAASEICRSQSLPVLSAGRDIVHTKEVVGYVYLVTNPLFHGWVKIGSTVDITKRLSSYQTSDPHRQFSLLFARRVSDRRNAEKQIFQLLAQTHEHKGEWVRATSADAIRAIETY